MNKLIQTANGKGVEIVLEKRAAYDKIKTKSP
jgi:hypothetical protein